MRGVAILTLALAAAFVPMLLRDTKRADQQRRRREFLRTNRQARAIREAFVGMQTVIGAAFLTAATHAAADFERQMGKLTEAMRQAEPVGVDQLRKLAEMSRQAKR